MWPRHGSASTKAEQFNRRNYQLRTCQSSSKPAIKHENCRAEQYWCGGDVTETAFCANIFLHASAHLEKSPDALTIR